MAVTNLYPLVVEFVNSTFQGKKLRHFERTVYWLEQLHPPLTEAMRIAAYSHDIERGFRGTGASTITAIEDYTDPAFLAYHQQRGAEIIQRFLQENDAKATTISIVVQLISSHEVGGDALQNALMHADSISFFETNAAGFVREKSLKEGYTSIKQKLDWMYNRIRNEQARAIAQPLYTSWIAELATLHKDYLPNS